MQVQRKKIVFFIVLWNFFLRKGLLVAPKLIFLPSCVRDCSPIGFGFLRSGTEQKAERKNWGGDLATHQFYTAKARPALAGTPICNLVCSIISFYLPIDKLGKQHYLLHITLVGNNYVFSFLF